MKESPELAMAIAAEHLIQVFYTHGSKLEQSEVATDVSKYLKNIHSTQIWYWPAKIYLPRFSVKANCNSFSGAFWFVSYVVQFGLVTKKLNPTGCAL